MTEQESNQLRSPERGANGFGLLFWAILLHIVVSFFCQVLTILIHYAQNAWEFQTPGVVYRFVDWMTWLEPYVYIVFLVLALRWLRGAAGDARWQATRKQAIWLILAPLPVRFLIHVWTNVDLWAAGYGYESLVPHVVVCGVSLLITACGFAFLHRLISLTGQSGALVGHESLGKWVATTMKWFWWFIAAKALTIIVGYYIQSIHEVPGDIPELWRNMSMGTSIVSSALGVVLLVRLLMGLWKAGRVCREVAVEAGERVGLREALGETLHAGLHIPGRLLAAFRGLGMANETEEEVEEETGDKPALK
mgnify:CR=1 FL=1